MKKLIILLIIILAILGIVLFLAGCDDDLITAMDRVARDPESTAPRVVSFAAELSVQVSWDNDEAADEYILRRAKDSGGALVYSRVYQGTETYYNDTSVEDEGLYLYTLSRLRGNKEFGPSDAVLGVGNECVRDSHESNDTKEDAEFFSCDIVSLNCNSYYYQQSGGLTRVKDDDWYSCTIAPGHRLTLKVVQLSPVIGSAGSCLRYIREGAGESEQIISDDPFAIDNNQLTEQTFRFKLFPDSAVCIDLDPMAGGTVIEYELVFVSDAPVPHSGD